jgi:membrane protease YdiL (CAAX protease family)
MGTVANGPNWETTLPAPIGSRRYPRIAAPTHTILLLIILGLWAMVGKMDLGANPRHVPLYLATMLVEWLALAYVVSGARRSGSIAIVLGDRWRSARQVVRDIGIAAAFWIVSGILLVIVGLLLHVRTQGQDIRFILPHGAVEFALWIAVSITAGICEEAIFRGYLQSQFIALTGNAPVGIFLSAVAFSGVHAYQGSRRMILIGLYGVFFGILAYWRRTVRPGMIAHAWEDSLSGLLGVLLRSLTRSI